MNDQGVEASGNKSDVLQAAVDGADVGPKFKDSLPADCPPCAATELDSQIVLRLVPSEDVDPDHFKSHAALGRPAYGDPCAFASCSVFLERKKRHDLVALTRLPKMRGMRYIAHVRVDQSSGLAKVNYNTDHIDLWMYKEFDPVGSTELVEGLS